MTLDLYLAYLRAAFHTCYYCAVITDHVEELQRKCIKHERKPLSLDSKSTETENTEKDKKVDEGEKDGAEQEKEGREKDGKEKKGVERNGDISRYCERRETNFLRLLDRWSLVGMVGL